MEDRNSELVVDCVADSGEYDLERDDGDGMTNGAAPRGDDNIGNWNR